jgi:pilus assembly protein CpaF
MAELLESGSVSASAAETIGDAISRKENILISGGNGSGKTTFLNAAAAAYIDHGRRIVCIENDVREIHLDNHRNKTHFVANAYWSVANAVEDALRHRIQTVLIGEIIGAEGMALLNALATGHSGSLATIHAEHAELALDRLTACAMQAAKGLTYQAVRLRVSQSSHYVVHMADRKVVSMSQVASYDVGTDRFKFEGIPRAEQSHVAMGG